MDWLQLLAIMAGAALLTAAGLYVVLVACWSRMVGGQSR